MNDKEILEHLKPKEEYILEIKKMHKELGVTLFTGTLNNDELDELLTKIYERVAIVEFIKRYER